MAEAREIDVGVARGTVGRAFESSIVPTLCRYIEIPNKSPAFDPDWQRARAHARAPWT